MKKGMVLLGIVGVALIVAAASYGGFGQLCSDAVELPEGDQYLDHRVVDLLAPVSQAIRALEHPQAYSYIRHDSGYAYVPHKAVIVGAEILDPKDTRFLEENVKDTLNRVGDLALSIMGDKKLIILADEFYGFVPHGYFLLDKKALLNPASCQYKTFTDEDQSAVQELWILADLLGAKLPGSTASGWSYYIPGFGGYVNLFVDYAPELLD